MYKTIRQEAFYIIKTTKKTKCNLNYLFCKARSVSISSKYLGFCDCFESANQGWYVSPLFLYDIFAFNYVAGDNQKP